MITKRRSERPEQLTLLRVSDQPVELRLDQRTRQRGLAHVAEIRAQLAAQAATHAAPARRLVAVDRRQQAA